MAKDFRNKTFQKILRGYSPEEVDSYLAYINDEYLKLTRKNSDTERKLTLAMNKLDEFNAGISDSSGADIEYAKKQAEAILKNAKDEAKSIVEKARKDADSVMKKAAGDAEKLIIEARNNAEKFYGSAEDLYDEVCSFRDSLFEIYNSHIESIESVTAQAKKFADSMSSRISTEAEPAEADDESDITKNTESDVITAADDRENQDGEMNDDSGEAEESIDSEDIARQRQLDKFFGIINDEDLLGADDESYNVADAEFPDEEEDFDEATRVLDLGDILRTNRKNNASAKAAENADDADFSEDSKSDDYVEIDSVLADNLKSDLSLTDEFDIVFSDKNSQKSVEEIRRQPTITPSAPQKKAHKKLL